MAKIDFNKENVLREMAAELDIDPDDLVVDRFDELEEKYAHEPMDGMYMWVSDVDAYVKKNPKLHARYGEAEDLEEVRGVLAGQPAVLGLRQLVT